MEDYFLFFFVFIDILEDAVNVKVLLDVLYQVLYYGENVSGDSYRFSVLVDFEDVILRVSCFIVWERFNWIYIIYKAYVL